MMGWVCHNGEIKLWRVWAMMEEGNRKKAEYKRKNEEEIIGWE